MENIQVILRVRPQNHQEVEANDQDIWSVIPPSMISLSSDRHVELIKSRKIGVGHRTDFNFSNDLSFCYIQIYRFVI